MTSPSVAFGPMKGLRVGESILVRDLTTRVTVQSYLDQEVLALDPFAQPDGFTCALLDITGQMYGIPVHRFFGQKVRDEGAGLLLVYHDGATRNGCGGRSRRPVRVYQSQT